MLFWKIKTTGVDFFCKNDYVTDDVRQQKYDK